MSERLKFQGRLAETQREAEGLKLRIKGLLYAIRNQLDPTEDVLVLDCEMVAAQAVEMASLHADYRAALDKIAAIKKVLGR